MLTKFQPTAKQYVYEYGSPSDLPHPFTTGRTYRNVTDSVRRFLVSSRQETRSLYQFLSHVDALHLGLYPAVCCVLCSALGNWANLNPRFYTGHVSDPRPNFRLCIVQGAMVYGSPAMAGFSVLAFITHVILPLVDRSPAL